MRSETQSHLGLESGRFISFITVILSALSIAWHLISARRLDQVIVNQKRETYRIIDFAIPADLREKLKESEKRDKYLDLAKELKKIWNMKMTVIPIVIGALDTIHSLYQFFGKGTGWLGNSTNGDHQNNRILRRVLETSWNLLSLKFQLKKTSTNAGVKKTLKEVKQ